MECGVVIEKWFCLRCNNCGEVINYWQEDSIHDAIEREREFEDTEVIASWNGNCFCNKKCQEEWLAKRRQARKDRKKMDKVMEKFLGDEK